MASPLDAPTVHDKWLKPCICSRWRWMRATASDFVKAAWQVDQRAEGSSLLGCSVVKYAGSRLPSCGNWLVARSSVLTRWRPRASTDEVSLRRAITNGGILSRSDCCLITINFGHSRIGGTSFRGRVAVATPHPPNSLTPKMLSVGGAK